MLGTVMTSPRVGPYVAMKCGTDGLPAARNQVAAQFLASDAQWLWWIDTDMGFAPDTVDRLLAEADPIDRPMVGALCFANREFAADGLGGYRCVPVPTLYGWHERDDGRSGFLPILDYPRGETVRVDGTGSACIVIHRSVMAGVAEKYGPAWYVRMTNPTTGQLIGEDLSFCARAAACGFPIHVATGVPTSHLKPIWMQEADYDPAVTTSVLTMNGA